MIPEHLLVAYKAVTVEYTGSDLIFNESQTARFFYQIRTGKVKMYNLNEKGKEFVQGLFNEGESFGEPPLFGDFTYPASAMALADTTLYKLSKKQLFSLLDDHFDIHLKLTGILAKRLCYKSMILQEISVHPPEHRVLTLVDFLKEKENPNTTYQLDLTRQQVADLTGLRVETVIRACKQLEADGEITIVNHKIHR